MTENKYQIYYDETENKYQIYYDEKNKMKYFTHIFYSNSGKEF